MHEHEMSYMGPGAFNHDQSSDAEAEYDRLRDLARQEAKQRNSCFQRSQEAYSSGDGAKAKELSEQGKAHGHKMDDYNKQASDFIFRENNASGRVAADTIDLHGQFVEEAEEIFEERVKYAKSHGQNHLHVIVGKGNHSVNHIQKIKPRVEQVCQELGLQYATEENAGRIYVNLTGGPADLATAPVPSHPHYQQEQQHQQHPSGSYAHPQQAQAQQGTYAHPNQQQQQPSYAHPHPEQEQSTYAHPHPHAHPPPQHVQHQHQHQQQAQQYPSQQAQPEQQQYPQQQQAQQQYPQQQQAQQHPQQQQQQQGANQDEIEQVVNAVLPKVLRKLEKACCVVM
ncbi:DUF1771-domain-containing protein [Aspergillus sclerotiicarbonarius CBS 121057]|uniref:DUF1771-domain-containing protein n=1 Tax=Aspergillus sclerotiicarbonarius (strain CBS 121057 / IBT 28362) TaxID=1448318 RepID=A0A319ESS8_ASPSB|nr:DUF1771-domain-containing protein [Aspergillus sclerotiicarbonarius CBS 121057]